MQGAVHYFSEVPSKLLRSRWLWYTDAISHTSNRLVVTSSHGRTPSLYTQPRDPTQSLAGSTSSSSSIRTTAFPQTFLSSRSFSALGTLSSPLYSTSYTTGLILPSSISGHSSSHILAFSSGHRRWLSPYLCCPVSLPPPLQKGGYHSHIQ